MKIIIKMAPESNIEEANNKDAVELSLTGLSINNIANMKVKTHNIVLEDIALSYLLRNYKNKQIENVFKEAAKRKSGIVITTDISYYEYLTRYDEMEFANWLCEKKVILKLKNVKKATNTVLMAAPLAISKSINLTTVRINGEKYTTPVMDTSNGIVNFTDKNSFTSYGVILERYLNYGQDIYVSCWERETYNIQKILTMIKDLRPDANIIISTTHNLNEGLYTKEKIQHYWKSI